MKTSEMEKYFGYESKGVGISSVVELVSSGYSVEKIEEYLSEKFKDYQINPDVLLSKKLDFGLFTNRTKRENTFLEYHFDESTPLGFVFVFAKIWHYYFTGIFHIALDVSFKIKKNRIGLIIKPMSPEVFKSLDLFPCEHILSEKEEFVKTIHPENFYYPDLHINKLDSLQLGVIRSAFFYEKALDDMYLLCSIDFYEVLAFVRGVFVLRNNMIQTVLENNFNQLNGFSDQQKLVVSLMDLIND